MIISKSSFIKSASKLSECPAPDYPEFALVGRSNVGKSSLINMITNRKALAKVSITPGKTQLLNYFLINDIRYLVDLPGYGYAKYSKSQRIDWMDTMQEYITNRPSLKRVFVLVDGSIPTQKIDLEFMQELKFSEIPFDIIITKIDKLNQSELHKNILLLKQELGLQFKNLPNIILSSSKKGRGAKEILAYIETIISN